MSIQIKYAYLKQQTWLYRRSYPKDIVALLGNTALKQSLKTGDASVARKRVRKLDAKFEEIVESARAGQVPKLQQKKSVQVSPVRVAGSTPFLGRELVTSLARPYLNKRSSELRWGGFKSIRYSVGLLVSKYGGREVGTLSREDGKEFLSLIEQLSPLIGKSEKTRGLSLDALVAHSQEGKLRIKPSTQKRIFRQVNHFLDWCVYEGQLEQNPFHTVQLEKGGIVSRWLR